MKIAAGGTCQIMTGPRFIARITYLLRMSGLS